MLSDSPQSIVLTLLCIHIAAKCVNRSVHVKHEIIHYCHNEWCGVMAVVHSSAILRVFVLRSMEILSKFDRILLATCTANSNKKVQRKIFLNFAYSRLQTTWS